MATQKRTEQKKKPMEKAQDMGFSPILDFEAIPKNSPPSTRLEAVRKSSRLLREKILSGPQVLYYKSFDLIRVPYPVKYGFLNAAKVPSPYLHILNRVFVVQFNQEGTVKTLLFSPSDIEGNEETPFFKRLSSSFGMFKDLGKKLIAPVIRTVEEALAQTGISPLSVDYISFDHLHTQDLRKWLGTFDNPGYFPNAKLLVMNEEWEAVQGLIPTQADWYCPRGIEGIESEKVWILEDSVHLGGGVSLLRTPGHTMGNHSLVAHTPEGIFVTSENGVGADNYSPLHSNISGVKKYAEQTGSEVILNGNTLESSVEQYISMVMEKEVAGPSVRNPNFYGVATSSEMTSYWAFPGIEPSFYLGELEFGKPTK
jgi:hypothetical protein